MSDEEGSGQEEAAFDFETNNTASTISRTDDEPFQFDGLPDLSEDESGHFKVPHVPSGLEPPKYNQHWVKPVFLNYEYIYDYRYISLLLNKNWLNVAQSKVSLSRSHSNCTYTHIALLIELSMDRSTLFATRWVFILTISLFIIAFQEELLWRLHRLHGQKEPGHLSRKAETSRVGREGHKDLRREK